MRWALLLLAACSEDPDPDFGVTCGDGKREEFENCDDGNRSPGDGCDDFCQPEPLVTVTWAFYPALGGPVQPDCRAGVAEIELVTEVNTSARFPCNAERIGTIFVPPGKKVFARLRGPADDILAESLPVQPPSTWRVDAPFYEDAGYIRASFTTDTMGCAFPWKLEVSKNGEPPATQSFTCKEGVGIIVSAPILADTYDVTFTNTRGDVHTRAGVVVGPNNRVTDLDFR